MERPLGLVAFANHRTPLSPHRLASGARCIGQSFYPSQRTSRSKHSHVLEHRFREATRSHVVRLTLAVLVSDRLHQVSPAFKQMLSLSLSLHESLVFFRTKAILPCLCSSSSTRVTALSSRRSASTPMPIWSDQPRVLPTRTLLSPPLL